MKVCGTVPTGFPSRIYFYVNKQCNLQCDYCYIKAVTQRDELDFIAIQSFIDFIKDKPVELRITGGEPTLHSRFVDIVEALMHCRVRFYLQTNGLWTDPVLNYLLETKNINVIVSPKWHEVGGNIDVYKKTLENVALLKSNRSAYIAINLVVSRKNIHFMKAIFEDFKSLGVHKISFIPLYPLVRHEAVKTYVFDGYNENREFMELVKSLTSQASYSGVCLAGIEWCNIEYDSHISAYAVYACSFMNDVYVRTAPNPMLAGFIDYGNLAQFPVLWNRPESWYAFREIEPGRCVLMKQGIRA